MTTNDSFDRRLTDWLIDDAAHRVSDHLDEILVQTSATTQRAWWSNPERWFPMGVLAPTRAANLRLFPTILVIAGLLAALAGAAALVGAMLRTSPDFALAENGRIYVASDATLSSYAADGTDQQTFMTLPEDASGLTFSPDGSYLAYLGETPPRVDIVPIDGGTVTSIDIVGVSAVRGPIAWSPNGATFVFSASDGSGDRLYSASPDGTDVVALGPEGIEPGSELWLAGWSPVGDQIAFVVVSPSSDAGLIHVMASDGRGVRQVGLAQVVPGSVAWSPDRSVERLVFTLAASQTSVRIIDASSGVESVVGEGQWPVWSPDGRRLALWSRGTQVVTTDAVLAGAPDPNNVFAQPAHTQPGMAPAPGRFTTCDNPERLSGVDICEPVSWSPDGSKVFGPDIAGDAIVIRQADGTGITTSIPIVIRPETEAAWQPIVP